MSDDPYSPNEQSTSTNESPPPPPFAPDRRLITYLEKSQGQEGSEQK